MNSTSGNPSRSKVERFLRRVRRNRASLVVAAMAIILLLMANWQDTTPVIGIIGLYVVFWLGGDSLSALFAPATAPVREVSDEQLKRILACALSCQTLGLHDIVDILIAQIQEWIDDGKVVLTREDLGLVRYIRGCRLEQSGDQKGALHLFEEATLDFIASYGPKPEAESEVIALALTLAARAATLMKLLEKPDKADRTFADALRLYRIALDTLGHSPIDGESARRTELRTDVQKRLTFSA